MLPPSTPAGVFGYEYNSGLLNFGSLPAASPSSLVQRLTLPGGAVITNQFDAEARWLGTHLRERT